MKIIVGLGNPGLRYRNTRHNIGFKVVSELAARHRLRMKKKGFQGIYGMGRIASRKVALFEPLTYMNLSGEAVEAVCARWIGEKKDLLVVTDDVNLSFGGIRVRERGSSGGHNGLQSIIDRIGDDFPRLRIGVGPEHPIGDMADYVLSPFPRKDKALLQETIERAIECIETWLGRGIKEAMNRYNVREQ